MDISGNNAKKNYIKICYVAPIISTFYSKSNLDKNYPQEHDIFSLINEVTILFLGDFNAIAMTNQDITLSNDSNPIPLSLNKDLQLEDTK